MAGNNIIRAEVEIEGVRPLFWHRFGPDALPLEKRERTGVAGNDPEEWRRSFLALPTGQLYLEPSYIFGSIRDGAKHTPKKRGTLQPLVAATLQVEDDTVLVDRFLPGYPELAKTVPMTPETLAVPDSNPLAPVYLDIRSVKNPATRARNVRYRIAASTGWHVTFKIFWDKTVVARGEMEGAIGDAGRFVGLGDARSIGYGRYVVKSFKVLTGDAE